MKKVGTALSAITHTVNTIDQMSHQIATAAEEQSAMAIEIERNTTRFSQISDRSQEQINIAEQLNREMHELSQQQIDLIQRFSSVRPAPLAPAAGGATPSPRVR